MAEGTTPDSVFFYGFQEGEYGTQGPWIVGWGLYRQHLYYKGWWTGQNVVKYFDGSIGPRSGLVNLNVGGLIAGKLNGLGYQPVPGKSGWCVINSSLYRFDAETPGSTATFIGFLSNTPTRPLASVVVGQYTYITNYGDQTYSYNPATGVLAGITQSPGGTCIAAYLDRLMVGCTSTAGNILWYSDPAPANGGPFTWQQIPARTITDGILIAGSNVLQSATAGFSSATDVKASLQGITSGFSVDADGNVVPIPTLPVGAYIQSVTDATHAVMSVNASFAASSAGIVIGAGNTPWQSEYIYVGDQWEVRSLTPLRNGLAISKQDGSWWLLTGTPGINDALRQVQHTQALGPIWPHRTALGGDQNVWCIPSGADFPGYFSGAKAANLKYLTFMGGNSTDDGAGHVDVGLAPIFQPDELLAVSGNASSPNTALMRRNGVFSKHTFGATVSGWLAQGNTGRMLLSDGGTVSTAPVMYALRASGIERPNIIGNNLESVGDASNTPMVASFTLPEWLERAGGLALVREVIVEFKTFNTGATGAGSTNHFDLVVTATRRAQLPQGVPVEDKSTVLGAHFYDEAGTSVGVTGAQDNRTIKFAVGEQTRGGGFILSFQNIRGVAITRIVAQIQTEPATL